MISFTSIASGSSGNAYSIKSDRAGSALIELGIPWKKILPAIGFRASALSFALCSHAHGDHSRSVKDALKAGIDVLLSAETASALGVSDHHRINILKAGKQVTVGGWTIRPFDLEHDVPCQGYVISDGEDRLLFIPDTELVEPRFSGITMIAAECNHIADILAENIQNGTVDATLGQRVRRTHMELGVLVGMLKANDLSRVRQIYLLHLSDSNSDEQRMKLEVQQATGVPVTIC